MTTKTLPDSTTAAYYYSGSGVTLVNTGTQGRPGASGINFGFVVSGNNDTLVNNGTVFGQRIGVYITGSGDSVTNAAGKFITATEAQQGGVNFYNFSGTVTNYGTISGFASATLGYGGNAVEMRHGGLVTNFGTLENGGALFRLNPGTLVNSGVVLGNAAYGGVYMEAGGTVTNLAGGTISSNGATESYEGAPPYGIFIHGGASTITNAGIINGGTGNAVLLPTGFQNRVIVDPGAVFVGTVNGGTAVDATLELASSASKGTLSGVGTQFINFGTVAFDSAASWLVDASTAISSSTITGFGATDTIDLAGFVAVSDTFASNTLVLTNASNAHVTLHVQGAFTTANFSLASDGSGGTDLGFTSVASVLVYGNTIDEAGIVATSETVTAGTMTLFNGASPVGTVDVGTSLASGDFILRSDGSGGTDVIVDTVFGTYAGGVTLLTNPTTIAATGRVSNTATNGKAVSGPTGTNWTLTNLGLVSETASGGIGVSLVQSGTIINASGGRITAASDGILLSGGGVVTNASGGTITGSTGVAATSATATVVNAGSIGATGAAAAGVEESHGGQVTNQSGGTITGYAGVIALGAAATVTNAGSIGANLTANNAIGVWLQTGGAVTNQSGGVIAGNYGVAFTGTAATLLNAGTIAGNATNSVAAAGFYAGAGGLVTNQSGGVITGYQGVRATAVALTVQNAGVIAGNNTDVTTTNTIVGSGYTYINNYVRLPSLAAGAYLQAGGAITNLSGGTISGYDGVKAGAAATVVNTGVIAGRSIAGTAVSTTISGGNTYFNTATVNPGLAAGVFLQAGGSVTNQSGGTISGYDGIKAAGAAATVVNAGIIAADYASSYQHADGVYLSAGGSVTNQSTGTISAHNDGVLITGATGTVINLGNIHAHHTSYGGYGVYLADGGTVTNGASGGTASAAYIYGYHESVKFGPAASGTLVNFGTLHSPGNSVGVVLTSGVVINGPSGATGAQIYDEGQSAIEIYGSASTVSTGTVINYGTITNNFQVGGPPSLGRNSGVLLQGAGVVRNLGSAALVNGSNYGVYGGHDDTVINAGTIEGHYSGGDAVRFAAGTNRLIVDPGAVFIGYVVAGGTSTLELASAATAGMLNGLGTQYTGFTAVAVDAGANWTLSGANTLGAGIILTDGGTLTDSGIFANAGVVTGAAKAILLATGGVISNQSGGVISATAATGIAIAGSGAGTLVNAGSVQGDSGNGFGVSLSAGGSVTNQSGGTISGARAIAALSGALTVVNAGSIVGGNTAGDFAIALHGSGSVSNQSGGVITGHYAIVAYASGATITNAGNVSGAYAVLLNGAGRLTNQSGGTISGSTEGVLANAVATVVNAGSISGVGDGVRLAVGGTVIAQTGGTISSPTDAVSFGSGHTNRLVVNQGAAFTGLVDGGNTIGAASISTLELASGASAGTLTGLGTQFTHFAQVAVDAGAQWTLSGTQTGFATLTNAGSLGGTAAFGVEAGAGASGVTVSNQSGGVITGTEDAVYVISGSNTGTVTNSGEIIGGITGFAAINLSDGGLVSNASGGTIAGHTAGVFIANGSGATVSNAGSIGASQAYGVWLYIGGSVTNATGGRITGGYTTANAAGVYLGHGGAVTNQSGGTIGGLRGVYALSAAATVVNAGHIAGSNTNIGAGVANTGAGIYLGDGGSVTNQSGGSITGYSGVLVAGASATVSNAGFIDGAYGVSLGAGGLVTNASGGTIAGTTGVYIGGGVGTVQNAGSIGGNLTSGSGIVLQVGGTVTNQLGGTISGSYGVKADGTATVVNAGSIGDGTSLATGAGIALKDGGLIVNQTGGNIIAGLQGIYIGGAAGTVVNAGSIGGSPANGNGVIFATGGAVTNQSGGTITGRYGVRAVSAAVSVVNTGSIGGNLTTGGGVDLAAGGSVTNQSGGTITGLKAVLVTGATVTNAGAIAGNTTLATGAGVRLTGGGSVTNQSGGTITGFDGIVTTGAVTVVNAGSIGGTTAVSFGAGSANRLVVESGAAFSGLVDGGNTIGAASISTLELASSASAGTLSGLGTQFVDFAGIAVDSGASWTLSVANTVAAGVTLTNAGTLTDTGTLANNGTILGTGTAAGNYGIVIGAAGILGNQGLIQGYGGVLAAGGATVTNAGTIGSTQGIDGVAIAFTGGNGRLIDDPGAVFAGTVNGGGGMLELASAGSTGTIAGFGGSVTNFTSLVFDAGAQWVVAGDDSSGGLGTLGIGGFTIGDTIDLTGFVATGETFASNVLTLSDGVGDFESLNIQGAFASNNFDIGTDGAGGTDITFAIPPAIVAGATVTFTGGGSPVTLDAGLSITDPNSATLAGGTVSIGSGFLSGDTLNFVAQNGISGSFDGATGTLTLTGSATLADYQAALESITYSFTAGGDPTAGGDTARVIDWVVNDGTNASTVASSTLDTVHVAPTITTGGTVSFTGGGSAVVLDSTLTLADTDSDGLLNGGTVSIAGFVAGDILSADTIGTSITTSYDGATGVLTLSGSDTLADYQAVLRSISYSVNPADGDPTGGGGNTSRTIDWLITDGATANGVSNTGTSTLDTVHVGPTITTGGTVSYVADGTPAVLDPTVTITDVDSAGTLAGATVSIGSGFTSGDLLNFTDQNGISGSYNAVSGTLTLSGGATIADYEAALESVTYTFTPSGGDPTADGTDASRAIAWSVNDGVDTSIASGSTLDLSLPPPVIAGTAAGQTTTDEATINPFSGVSITDPNSAQSETITITVTNAGTLSDADGTLSGTGLTQTGTGTYTLAAGTPAAVTTALEALVFTPTAQQVAPGATITTGFTLAVTDTLSQGATDGTTSVVATAVNDPPVITGSVAGQTTTDEAAVSPFSGVGISDIDVGQTETVTVTLSNAANGVLSNLDGGSYDSGTGVYSVTGTDAAVTTAVDGLVFTPTAHQVVPGDSVTTTFTIAATDTAGGTASDSTTTVGATAVNDSPVITGAVAGQTTTDEAALSPFSGVGISDADFGQTETVTVTLSSAANGTLSNLDGGSYDSGTGVYSVTGTDAAVTTAVDGLVFTPTVHQVAPGDSVTTTFTITTTDTAGGTASDGTTTVDATAVNDPPVITGTVAGQRTLDTVTIQPFSGVTISDPDVGASETVTITLTDGGSPTDADGTLSGTGLSETGTGTYTLTAGTPDAVTTALDALVFTPTQTDVTPYGTITTGMTLSVTDGIIGTPTTDTNTSVNSIACFAAGTRIATPRGAVAVERLREGDKVLTVSGKARPVQWVGRRTLEPNRHPSPERVKPVRIAPHAFGENRPRRALLLSPDHSVFMEDVMIPIRHLINGTTITQLEVPSVTYYHIELDRHDVVLAEGLPAETYLETGGRCGFENGGGVIDLHPDFEPDENRVGMVWRNFAYAPLIDSDALLGRVRVRLALQALMLGQRGESAGGAPQREKRVRRAAR